MAIIITSPVTGSLKINNNSASPQSNYLCNLQTVNIIGNVFQQAVDIQNSNGQVIVELPLKNISNIGASGSAVFPTLQNAVDAIASLVMK